MQSDIFVLCDQLQYIKKDWQNRNRIRVLNKGWKWLSVPIRHMGLQKITEVLIDNSTNWRDKHWKTLVSNYGKASFFKDYQSF
ncbi:WbqC family protein, partial [Candidatus Bathyarchaeota archaeon]|nr:WbqC family protein [Candidatus Bathyarchaeota archaeon]